MTAPSLDPRPHPALHLVRHGEVLNPDHVVYASLEGFGLSDLGRAQAAAASDHLTDRDVEVVVSSPLQRAVETATPIAEAHRVTVETDDRLVEWALGDRWAGHPWEALPERFPGELEAYLADPTDLAFVAESLEALADRVTAVVAGMRQRQWTGGLVVVAHQDPLQAARKRLTGRPLTGFHDDKLGHASVVTLVPDGSRWSEVEIWQPALPS